jgi:hypothetical protein
MPLPRHFIFIFRVLLSYYFLRFGKYERKDRKVMKNTEENSEKIWKIWKKGKLNSGKIWKIKWRQYDRKYLRFRWNNTLYQFTCLAQGLALGFLQRL